MNNYANRFRAVHLTFQAKRACDVPCILPNDLAFEVHQTVLGPIQLSLRREPRNGAGRPNNLKEVDTDRWTATGFGEGVAARDPHPQGFAWPL